MTIPTAKKGPRRPARRRKDWVIVAVLLGLAALVAYLWFADPAHQWPGRSRVDWPPPTKP